MWDLVVNDDAKIALTVWEQRSVSRYLGKVPQIGNLFARSAVDPKKRSLSLLFKEQD